MSWAAAAAMGAQALAVEPLRQRLGEGRTVYWCCIVVAVAQLTFGLLPKGVPVLLMSMAVVSCMMGVDGGCSGLGVGGSGWM